MSVATGLALLPVLAHAQGAGAPSAADIAALKQAVADAKMSADNAWMLVCAALVLMMTGPGLALFYGGLVRKKNVLGTMMQSFAMMAIITVLWAVVGYSLPSTPAPALSADCIICFCTAWALRPIPTTPPPFRSRPS